MKTKITQSLFALLVLGASASNESKLRGSSPSNTLEESTTAGQKEVNKSVATVAKAFKVLMMGVNENIFGGEFDETSYSCCSKNGEKCQYDKQCESGWCDWHGLGYGTCETCPPKEEQTWADSCDPK